MAKITWTFKNEEGTNLNRYIATNVSTGERITFDLLRNGNISVVGTPLNAENLNALITSINACYDLIASSEKDTTYTLSKNGNAIRLTSSDGTTNDVTLNKSDVGLSNVDNTSDLNKPISTATQNALDNKVPITRKINGKALNEDINLSASDVDARPSGWTPSKSDVGLGNVDNTSDLNKPISTATQNSLNTKADKTTTQNSLNKSLYNLGAFDTISGNVITRKTGYINKNNITSYGINGAFPYATFYIRGDFISNINNVDNNSSNKNTNLYGLTTTEVSIENYDGNFNDRAELTQFINELEIQYETKTSYTEEIIEGQPLITLDSQGSEWLRDEWEKGINLWNEKTQLGTLSHTNGSLENSTTRLCSKDFIAILSNTNYIFNTNNVSRICFYDSSKNFISTIVYSDSSFLTPSNSKYMKFDITSNYGTTYKYDIMLNEGNHAYPYQEYNGGIVRENQLKALETSLMNEISSIKSRLDWIERNLIIEKTKSVSGRALTPDAPDYYYSSSFTVDGTVKSASFSSVGSGVSDSNINFYGNTIVYTLYTRTSGSTVTGTIKYTYGK